MRKTELKELYKLMFPDYPDIVTVAQLQQMLGVSRHLAYSYVRGNSRKEGSCCCLSPFCPNVIFVIPAPISAALPCSYHRKVISHSDGHLILENQNYCNFDL